MNISSVIVRTRPEKLGAVLDGLALIPGVEVHADPGDGRLVLTIEDREGCSTADAFVSMHQLDGVLTASLVYEYCDDDLGQESTT
jgi:periplasmic nitrate reductase NapD